jgi:hypothetical protein
MLITLAVLLILAVLLLTVRLRLKLSLAPDRKLLFVGLGRSGPEFHLGQKRGELKLFGRRITTFETGKKEKPEEEPDQEVEKEKTARKKTRRKRSIRDILAIVPQSSKALWRYFIDLVKATIIEQAEGEIAGGFDSPDLTGQAFGFYQAAIGAVPALAGRFRFVPDWTGASFSGAARLTVALPIYRLVGRTLLLIWRLPVRKIVKLAIGEKGGDQDGEQRS